MKVLSIFLVSLALASAGEVSYKMKKKIAIHHMYESCWGKQNMKGWYEQLKTSVKKCQGLTPTFDLGIFEEDQAMNSFGPFSNPSQPSAPVGFDRNNNLNIKNPYEAWLAFLAFQQSQQKRFKREVKAKTAAEKAAFKVMVKDYKMEKMENLGNLTCVMADMGVLDANLNIDMNFFKKEMWEMLVEPVDPEFKSKMIENIEDCSSIAQSIPQSILDKNPVYKKIGRHMIFFKCQHKAEYDLCAKQELSRYMEEVYGPSTAEERASFGLPEDKFDAAYMAKKVKINSLTESEKFVYKFIMTGKAQ